MLCWCSQTHACSKSISRPSSCLVVVASVLQDGEEGLPAGQVHAKLLVVNFAFVFAFLLVSFQNDHTKKTKPSDEKCKTDVGCRRICSRKEKDTRKSRSLKIRIGRKKKEKKQRTEINRKKRRQKGSQEKPAQEKHKSKKGNSKKGNKGSQEHR